MRRVYKTILKTLTLFFCGASFTGVVTLSTYALNREAIRSSESQLVRDILISLSFDIKTTLDQVFMPELIGFKDGRITRELFTLLTNSSVEISNTSFSWIPIVRPDERDAFIANSSVEYPG